MSSIYLIVGSILATGYLASDKSDTTGVTLLDFGSAFNVKAISTHDAAAELVWRAEGYALRVRTGHSQPWPGITLKAPSGRWDLSAWTRITLDVHNLSDRQVCIFLRVNNPGADGRRNCVTGSVELAPGGSGTLTVPLRRRLPQPLAEKLFGMRGYPGGMVKEGGIDASDITQLLLFVNRPETDHLFEITSPRAVGPYSQPEWLNMSPEDFFPMIDRYGQFIHEEWPGKTSSDEDLHRRREEETVDLTAHPGPKGWDRFGGWMDGPRLKATGFFRVQKYKGKWWLVDPEGCLFWSHGIDCVRWTTGVTPITNREFYFAELPPKESPFGIFYGSASWAPHGYYHGKHYETFNFTGANLLRKYGPDWKRIFSDLCHRRLRSWGMNTIGNWSESEICLMRRTPYVVAINGMGRPIEGSAGYWGKFPDPFDPSFKSSLHNRMKEERGRSANDPWCIGYFVHNELSWGDEFSLAEAALLSPADQPAKQEFLRFLRGKYGGIEALNNVWGTNYESWDDLLISRRAPSRDRAGEDLKAFYTEIAEAYFRICREAVKEIAPNQLYLGCRFAWVNELAIQAAAKYCDVISFNRYQRSVADLHLPDGMDKPVIIGEFHFGALDRGMFHTGLVPVKDQQERAQAYINYVHSALGNPLIVGTHWFQFGDQPTTGRGDGENYQIGFLDICDTPYIETIKACREVGYTMYPYRMHAGK
ncbi:beta-galactosidase [Candidatus Poribacteria bacterium]|nr:beta-galactosidase [Candidatus Poribacteria bacterium]